MQGWRWCNYKIEMHYASWGMVVSVWAFAFCQLHAWMYDPPLVPQHCQNHTNNVWSGTDQHFSWLGGLSLILIVAFLSFFYIFCRTAVLYVKTVCEDVIKFLAYSINEYNDEKAFPWRSAEAELNLRLKLAEGVFGSRRTVLFFHLYVVFNGTAAVVALINIIGAFNKFTYEYNCWNLGCLKLHRVITGLALMNLICLGVALNTFFRVFTACANMNSTHKLNIAVDKYVNWRYLNSKRIDEQEEKYLSSFKACLKDLENASPVVRLFGQRVTNKTVKSMAMTIFFKIPAVVASIPVIVSVLRDMQSDMQALR